MARTAGQSNPLFELGKKGFINIGSHPDNDIVLNGNGVLPFHAMIDCRQDPYRLAPLSGEAEIYLNNGLVPTGEPCPFGPEDSVGVGNNRLKLLPASNGTPLRLAVAGAQDAAEDSRTALSGGVAVAGFLAQEAPGELGQNEVILASLDREAAEISVEQTANYTLSLINGSMIVSTFHVQVEGVPEEWVMVSPANVNLNEGARAQVFIAITPPRWPTSTAGEHPLRVVVTSHNHPGLQTVVPAMLTIAPYYEYAITDIAPKRQYINFGQPAGKAAIEITNRGNSSTPFILAAADEENGCRFQFPDETGLNQVGSAQFNLGPGETRLKPVHVSPIKRSLIRLRSRQYSYRVVVTEPQNEGFSLFTMGTAVSRPLINALGLLLIMLCLVGTTAYLFTPRITAFAADNNLIGVGESTTLRWRTFFFTHDLSIAGLEKPVRGSQGALEIFPASTVNSYTLSASTWLWSLLGLPPRTATATVLSVPGEPLVSTFTASSTNVLVGDEVGLRYSVDRADKVLLTVNGVTETLDDPKTFNGERKLLIEKPTLVSIVAQNSIDTTVRSLFLNARQPSIQIDRFELDKTSVYTGEQVTIYWKVSGVGMENGGEVTISAFDSVLPLEGQMTFFPKESMEFVLTAKNRQLQESRILPVGVLEPGAPPEPPKVDFFTAAPDTLVGPGNVELSWSVSGAYDSIKITNGSSVVAEGLSAQGFKTISVSESGTYVLTATNKDQSAGANLKITVNPAMIKPALEITTVYPDQNLVVGDSTTVSINIVNPKANQPPPTGKVIVTDGTSSCEINLPTMSCKLSFATPGDKNLIASYQGDSNHVQAESVPYPATLKVMGTTITLVTTVNPVNTADTTFYYNQQVSVGVTVSGTNPSRIPDGEIRVKRICDPAALYTVPCTDAVIGYHQLMPADTGYFNFSPLVIDQVGGHWNLQISFMSDSFYSPAAAAITLMVDGSTSPVSLSAATPSTVPYEAKQDVGYTLMVRDENALGFYSVPKGKVTLTATNTTNSSLKFTCSNLTLSGSGDGRTATAPCTLNYTRSGEYSMSMTYTHDPSDVIHTDMSTALANVLVNTNVTMTPNIGQSTNLFYKVDNTYSLDLIKEDTSTNITTGSLTCSFPNGATDGSCSCSHDTGSTWDCTLNPITSEALPVTKVVTFDYAGPSGSYLNSKQITQTFQVVKATTTAHISGVSQTSYSVGSSIPLQVTATNNAGGTNPASGTIEVSLGTGSCIADSGMAASEVIDLYTQPLGTATPKLLETKHVGALRFCVRYAGNNSFEASPWVGSNQFTVNLASTTASIIDQPDASYGTGDTYSITVKASSSSGTDLTSGTVTIQFGSGTCNTTTGMTAGLIGTPVTSQTVGVEKIYTFASANVGNGLRFCVRYNGDGSTYGASPYVSSTAFRVKARPAWSITSPVTVNVAPNGSTTSNFSITVGSGYQLSSSQVTIVDSGGTTVCPGNKCTLSTTPAAGTSITLTYKYNTTTAEDKTLTARYAEDSNNLAAQQDFTMRSVYKLMLSTPATDVAVNKNLWAYTSMETDAGDNMQMTVTGKVSFEGFPSGINYNNQGLTAAVAAYKDDGTSVAVADTASCSIANDGVITCIQVGVSDSNVSKFTIKVTASDTAHYTGQTESPPVVVSVIQNVVETPSTADYGLHIGNGGCTVSDQQVFNVSGYVAGPGGNVSPSDFVLWLACEHNNDGDHDYDEYWWYYPGNSEFSNTMGWTGNKFAFTITPFTSYGGYKGCQKDSDTFILQLWLASYHLSPSPMYLPMLDSPWVPVIKDFEAFTWAAPEITDSNADGNEDENWDYCIGK